MSTTSGIERSKAGIPDAPTCAACGVALAEPFDWCSNCQEAYCHRCGQEHYCHDGCRAAGCIAGLCVRTVENGRLSTQWKTPPKDGNERA